MSDIPAAVTILRRKKRTRRIMGKLAVMVEDKLATRSRPKTRRFMVEYGFAPLLLSDGKDAYWDGRSAVRPGTGPWGPRSCWVGLEGGRELRVMIHEGYFPEARGAWIHEGMWWKLRDHLAGDTVVPGLEVKVINFGGTREQEKL
jgi:hypothetical protein